MIPRGNIKNESIMVTIKQVFIYILSAVLMACVVSAFMWAVFCIVNGTTNGGEWHALSKFLFLIISLLSLCISIVGGVLLLEAKFKN